ncbi:MAG: serine/threonine protein kinase [Gemmataceae bacterium]|nr:serine/threonine protein kinase [Gemmataceae bacterium]
MTEESLFQQALDLPPDQRAEFLNRECPDPALRARIEALLAADAAASPAKPHPDQTGLYSQPPGSTTGDRPLPEEAEGAVIAGRYKLRQQIGEGGMGTVWMADQTEPIKRKVAVKLIRAERGQSKTILARFEAERQAIALMDHPHIAKLLDAGTTDNGAPFFVMELVKGVPLNDFCDQHRLTVPERLNLFMQICSAVQHAHQKGIIHRDLKPSNILVESHDGKPVPKVIDFGLAKATTGLQLTEQSLFTAFGNVMGTPLYMAPEQASFNAIDVATRADVYALGVILYELLTGTTPITRETFRKMALEEMLRLIREQEAPTPSSRLSSDERAPSVAANRQMEPAKLGRFVKGELDWIVMKALSKERERRYETANGFARDIERFLNHEPVSAGPPSAVYRMKKFLRRHRGPVIAASLVLLALVGGIIGTTWGLLEARRQAEIARAESEAKELARAEEANQRATAEAREREANHERDLKSKALDAERKARTRVRLAMEEMTSLGMGEWLSGREKLTAGQKAFLERTLELYSAFADDSSNDPEAKPAAARAYVRISEILTGFGRTEDALRANETARQRFQELIQQYPKDPEFHFGLLTALEAKILALENPRPLEAEKAQLDLIAQTERLTKEFPQFRRFQEYLVKQLLYRGNTLTIYSRHAEALKVADRADGLASQIYASNPNAPEAVAARAKILDRRLVAQSSLRESPTPNEWQPVLDYYEKEAREEHFEAVGAAANVARIRINFAIYHLSRGEYEQAIEQARQAEHWAIELVATHPGSVMYRWSLAQAYLHWARAAWAAKRPEAEEVARLSVASWARILHQAPDRLGMGQGLAAAETNLAHIILDAGRPKDAISILNMARDRLLKVVEAGETNTWTFSDLEAVYRIRAAAYEKLNDFGSAEKDWLQAAECAAKRNKGNPSLYEFRQAVALIRSGQADQANPLVENILKKAKQMHEAGKPQVNGELDFIGAEFLLAGGPVQAERVLRENLKYRETMAPDSWFTFNTMSMLGGALLGQKKYADAEPLLVKGYDGLKAREKTIPPQGQDRLPEALDRLIELYTATNMPEEVKKYQELRAKYPPAKEVSPMPKEDKK